MDPQLQFCSLLDLLYRAAGDDAGWKHFLKRLVEQLPSATASLVLFDPQKKRHSIDLNAGLSGEATRLYNQHYAAIDEWYLRARGRINEGWVGDGRKLCPHEELVRTEFYNDFLRPFGWLHECAAVLEMRGSTLSVLALLRDEHRPEFSSRDIALISRLVPHLQRALHLHRRIVDLKVTNEATRWALDQVAFGVVLLAPNGYVLTANAQAERMAAQGVIRLTRSGLHAVSIREDDELQAAIRAAGSALDFSPSDGSMVLSQRDGGRIAVLVAPIRVDSISPGAAVGVFLSVLKPGGATSRTGVLRALFQLTPAEARLADLLGSGTSLPEAAEILRVSRETVRTQLKIIFQKTGTSRQAQLVRLILLLPTCSNDTSPYGL